QVQRGQQVGAGLGRQRLVVRQPRLLAEPCQRCAQHPARVAQRCHRRRGVLAVRTQPRHRRAPVAGREAGRASAESDAGSAAAGAAPFSSVLLGPRKSTWSATTTRSSLSFSAPSGRQNSPFSRPLTASFEPLSWYSATARAV